MKKRFWFVAGSVFFLLLFLASCGIPMEDYYFWHVAHAGNVASAEVVYVREIHPDGIPVYEHREKIKDVNAIVDDILDLTVIEFLEEQNANRGVREQALMFRFEYRCGCWELFDAAGKNVYIGEECNVQCDPASLPERGHVILDVAEFDQLVEEYNKSGIGVAEDAFLSPKSS